MRRKAAHASLAVVVHRLVDLGPRVHHKGPLANDRFLDRLPIEEPLPDMPGQASRRHSI
jgi:hypothetical protein